VLVFFSASHSKLPFYILPIFPALAMLIARRMAALGSQALTARFMVMALLATALAIVAITWPADTRHLSQSTDLHPLLLWFSGGLGVLALLGAVAAVALMLGARRQSALILVALGTLCVWQVLFVYVGRGANELSARPVAELMQPQMRPDTQVFSVRAYQRGLSFYLRRLVTIVDEHPADIVPGGASRPDGLVPHIRDFEKRWSAAPHALAVVAPDLLTRLRKDGLPMRIVGVAHAGVVIERTPMPGAAAP
jgi:4-amino-4-deoxy-L-arabinose transferase and related glycosyltransferases of PMT family